MKRKFIFLFILILLFVLFIIVRFVILDKQNSFGRVRILSTPPTTVFINDVAVGKTPYEEQSKVGEFTIKLIPQGEGSQVAPWQGKIKVEKNAMTYVNAELNETEVTSAGEILTITKMENKSLISNSGEVYVETQPSGAIVYLDNDEKGVSPLLLQNVTKGDHELSVFLPGFLRRTQKINVETGFRVGAMFKLALDPTNKTLEQTLDEKRQEASAAAEVQRQQQEAQQPRVIIGNTPTGFLRVRSAASVSSSEIAQVKPAEMYPLLEEANGWFKIKVGDVEGWVSAQYATKQEVPEESTTPNPTSTP